NNGRTDVGTQEVTATITGDNFTTLVLTADLTVTPATVADITFADDSFVYDGTAKSLVISGILPEGTSVSYSNNSRTDVGSQEVTATITGDNYTSLVLAADLTVTPATVIDITFADDSFVYDGTAKSMVISGTLPDGTSVSYSNNSRTDVGSQEVTATISGANFTGVSFTANLSITKAILTVKADSGQGKEFGMEDPELTYQVSGLQGSDSEAIITGALSRGAGEDVGTYLIQLGSLSAGANYMINFTGAEFRIISIDTDGDGVPDDVEAEEGTDPDDPTDYADSDGDDVPDYVEDRKGTDPVHAGDYLDTDGDDVPDYVEEQQGSDLNDGADFVDIDEDGIPDYVEDRSVVDFISHSIDVQWGTMTDELKLPEEVVMITANGEFINQAVTWDLAEYEPMSSGTGSYTGIVALPAGLFNPSGLQPTLEITVLAKPAPQDVTLSENSFIGIPDQFFQEIGAFTVVDPTDDQHSLSLPDGVQDNGFFEVLDGILFWSSAEQAEGRTDFTIVLSVSDRAGNILEKEFSIIRERTPLEQLPIPNSFTPNGDGVNDTWGMSALRYYGGVRISVFAIGGDRLFYTENPDIRWDGVFNGKVMPVGAYLYVIEVGETGEIRRGMLNLVNE
ncbi:gliding motility-associated C-terminal domain-containing protein, partial [Algoriphagus locisalis]